MWPSTSMSAFPRLSGAGQEDRKHRTSGCLPLPRACRCPPSSRKVRQNSESKLRFVEEDIRQASPTPVFSDSTRYFFVLHLLVSSASSSSSHFFQTPLLSFRHPHLCSCIARHLLASHSFRLCCCLNHFDRLQFHLVQFSLARETDATTSIVSPVSPKRPGCVATRVLVS